jgi:hypothetical protein
MSRLSSPDAIHRGATPSGSALGQVMDAADNPADPELDSGDVKTASGLYGVWSMATTGIRSSASWLLPVRPAHRDPVADSILAYSNIQSSDRGHARG